MFLTFIYMKNVKTKTGGMVLKSRLSLNGTGQRTDPKSNALYATNGCHPAYAQFLFQFISDFPEKNVLIRFTRRTDIIMPSVPLETKYHPSAVDILLIKNIKTDSFAVFLQHEFVNFGKSHAERLNVKRLAEMKPYMMILKQQRLVRKDLPRKLGFLRFKQRMLLLGRK